VVLTCHVAGAGAGVAAYQCLSDLDLQLRAVDVSANGKDCWAIEVGALQNYFHKAFEHM